MAIPENPPNTPEQNNPSEPRRLGSDYCLASGLRRKFLDFCDENPGAEECRVYDSIARYDAEARGVIMGPVSEGAWDGVLAVGPVTASPPMAGEPVQAPEAISAGSSS